MISSCRELEKASFISLKTDGYIQENVGPALGNLGRNPHSIFEMMDQSTAELPNETVRNIKFVLGLNPNPLDYEPCTLPMSYTNKMEIMFSKHYYKSNIRVLPGHFSQYI